MPDWHLAFVLAWVAAALVLLGLGVWKAWEISGLLLRGFG